MATSKQEQAATPQVAHHHQDGILITPPPPPKPGLLSTLTSRSGIYSSRGGVLDNRFGKRNSKKGGQVTTFVMGEEEWKEKAKLPLLLVGGTDGSGRSVSQSLHYMALAPPPCGSK